MIVLVNQTFSQYEDDILVRALEERGVVTASPHQLISSLKGCDG